MLLDLITIFTLHISIHSPDVCILPTIMPFLCIKKVVCGEMTLPTKTNIAEGSCESVIHLPIIMLPYKATEKKKKQFTLY